MNNIEIVELLSFGDISGFGDAVVKLIDRNTGSIICYFGVQDEKEKLSFTRTCTPEELEKVLSFIKSKKFSKYFSKEQYKEVQSSLSVNSKF